MSATQPWPRRIAAWLVRERWTLAIFVAALVVRVHWNLFVHPPADYVYSDMNGYVGRAEGLFVQPWSKREYAAFYPWGTHVLMFAVERVFGKGQLGPVGVAFAVIGAANAMFGYLLARRASRFAWVAPVVGTFLVLDYPMISLSGYFLSETPFALGMLAGTWLLLRVVDHGRRRDAWLAGFALAFATVMRPQILVAVALLGPLWFFGRRLWPRLTLRLLLHAAAPLLLVLAFSAWRLHYHTGRYGLISENGSFNQVFGRCHVTKIIALPDQPSRSRTVFGPPPLLQLAKRASLAPGEWPQLDPVIDKYFYYYGYIGDAEKHGEYMRQCVAQGGLAKQAEFALVHVLMLWRYNVLWPDSGKGKWAAVATTWGVVHASVFAIPAVLAALLVFWPARHPKLALVAVHLWSAFIVAAIYFGDVRLRTPYDPIIVLLAVELCAMLGTAAWRRWTRNRGRQGGVEAVGSDPAR
ncbi:MAG: hypothetical protein IPH07_07145 [Deltaproteobacteria bacterium]|nr:hypothetical protein [Deltaproteobacteria bacterium]MBP7287774.1 hypothetical protein [Nannocystaceae bacterium]